MIFLRARIETMSSISENLQCSQRICETVATPYSFDDYLAEKRGIKEGGGFRWQTQAPSPAFPLPHDLYNLNPFGYAAEESDFLKVHQSFSLYSVLLFFTSFSPLLLKKKKIQGGVHCWISLWSFKFQLFLSRIFAFLDLKVEFSTHVMEHGPSHNALNLCLRPMLLSLVSLDCVLHVSQIKETVVLFIVCLFGCFFSSPLFFFGFFFPLFFVLILFLKLRRLWKGFI